MEIPGIRKDMAENFCPKDRTLRRKEDWADDVSSVTERLKCRVQDSVERYTHTKSHHHRQ
jgi:hypothetical protein